MKRKIAIYLAGTIKKGHETPNESYWTDEDMSIIRANLKECDVSFLNPAYRTDDLSDQLSVFGRDMLQVFSSNIVFVDARERRGLGVGAEMMWAKVNNIPVVTWAPRNSHYHKDHATILGLSVAHYVHPFVEALSDKIVNTVAEGSQWIHDLISNPATEIKGLQHIGLAMQHYKDSQLQHDHPMKEMMASCEELKRRMQRSHPQIMTPAL